jgi:hypothetical protein
MTFDYPLRASRRTGKFAGKSWFGGLISEGNVIR